MMAQPALSTVEPAIARLIALAPLGPDELNLLLTSAATRRRFGPHREILAEGKPIPGGRLVLQGWACRTRIFRDGRRQILSFLLPGDLIGICTQPSPVATTLVTALTEVILCPVPDPAEAGPGLQTIYAVSRALEEAYLFRQIGRLGRLSAYERLADWMMEIQERLLPIGEATSSGFPMPITQEALGDALGLTSVHVNRTLRQMRHEGLMDIRGGRVSLIDRQRLIQLADFRPTNIGAVGRQD
jgi:CRP-like cAMP-binding protein